MIHTDLSEQIKQICMDPSWKLVTKRFEMMLERADIDLHSAKDFNEFLVRQGAYNKLKEVVRLMQNPQGFADDGVRVVNQMGVTAESLAAFKGGL